MAKRLTKGPEPVLGGVVSGFAEYFGIDPLPLRLLFLALIFLHIGFGFLYVISWILMPEGDGAAAGPGDSRKTGLLIVALGLLLLLRNFFPQVSFTVLAAAGLIALGIFLVLRRR